MKLVLGIDLGTSYFKLGLFDREGNLCGLGRVEVAKDIPLDGYCELPVTRFWSFLNDGLKQACQQAGALPSDIVGIGYSSQANSFILIDKKNKPLASIIIWNDKRAKIYPQVKEIFAKPDFLQTTGFGIEPKSTLCINKLLWFQEKQADIWQKTEHIMTISDYLIFSLTGEKASDAGTSSMLGITDTQHCRWWKTAFDTIGIEGKKFSRLSNPLTMIGNVNNKFNRLNGLKDGIPVAAGSLDHYIAAIGAGAGTIAAMSESTGTVLACLSITDKFEPQSRIITGKGIANTFWKLAFDNNGAVNLEWYMKNYASEYSFEQLTTQAEKISAGCDGLSAFASAGSYKGLNGFVNAESFHSKAHYFRALMESSAYTLKQLIEKLSPQDKPATIAATGGGSKNPLWLQIKADMTGSEFLITNCSEPACKGSAMLAAESCRWYESLDDVSKNWIKIIKKFKPNQQTQKLYERWISGYKKIGQN